MVTHAPAPPSAPSRGMVLDWVLCARCRRAYVSSTYRRLSFLARGQEHDPDAIRLCPYFDCGAHAQDRWRWSIVRVWHPEYPEQPAPGVRYGGPDVAAAVAP